MSHWPREEIRSNCTRAAKVKQLNIFQDHYPSEGDACGRWTLYRNEGRREEREVCGGRGQSCEQPQTNDPALGCGKGEAGSSGCSQESL